ncbi:enoyl-CoA hydratase/isomerase family protein [Alphaproteobacteria bacterium]|nr:enoyl-CoA hydratase/isomerase family protein [Alphaproteobacteria bacterium]
MVKFSDKYQWVSLKKTGFKLEIILNRPEARNAMNAAMAIEIIDILDSASLDSEIAVILIRGEGPHFSAGGDLKDMIDNIDQPKSNEDDELYLINRRFGDLLTKVNLSPQVIISIVNGAARGGGFGIVCSSDIVIALNNSTYAMPETGFGLPGAQIIPFVVNRLGKHYVRNLVSTGRVIDSNEAWHIGLINYLCSDIESAEKKLVEILSQIKSRSPSAIMESKKLIEQVNFKPLSLILDDGAKKVAEMSRTGDGSEGLKAFLEKRKPSWVNRES